MNQKLWEEITGAVRPGIPFRVGELVDRCPSVADKTARRQVDLITETLLAVRAEYDADPARHGGVAPCSRPSLRTWQL
jgi:hypothetical protein